MMYDKYVNAFWATIGLLSLAAIDCIRTNLKLRRAAGAVVDTTQRVNTAVRQCTTTVNRSGQNVPALRITTPSLGCKVFPK